MNAPDPLIVDYVKRAGFGEVMNLTHTSVDMKFILALCERWRPETHTFHLPMGECTVTLEDVYMLLGLKTNGKAVYGNVQQPNALCVELLGVDLIEGEGQQRGRGQGIKLAGLQLAYAGLQLDQFSDEETILQKTRMYIMLLFGKFLFPEGTGNSVNFMYLCLLGDIDAIKTYSWGSAVLAYLYSSLCKCAKKDSCTFSGCAFLLQAWAWWRMPVLAPANPNSYAFPYASRFNALGMDWSKTPDSKIIFYRQILDRLGPQDVIPLKMSIF
ncbi:protein MAIN-LIKE 2-like isoform X2 [Vicia villosa]|uniref:protein MAIN-LIKE 2-like isoform X2 n=1 Tax=Vicia villosa TaxID=3911 RepID=UPI00273C570B|nr:protein MAIN-LIKE 2-like isoform X2 [Vicia villosa]